MENQKYNSSPNLESKTKKIPKLDEPLKLTEIVSSIIKASVALPLSYLYNSKVYKKGKEFAYKLNDAVIKTYEKVGYNNSNDLLVTSLIHFYK